MPRMTSRRAKAGRRSSSTPMATASAMPAGPSPKASSIRRKDKRIITGLYGVSPNPADGTVWGTVLGFPGGIVRYDPKTQLTEYYEVPWKNQQRATRGGLRAARRRHHQRRRVLDGAGERPFRELRPQAVQGQAERTGSGRSAEPLPGRLEALSDAWARVRRSAQGHARRQRRSALLQLGRSVRHARPRQEHARSPPATNPIRWRLS